MTLPEPEHDPRYYDTDRNRQYPCALPHAPAARARKLLRSGKLVDLERPRVEDIVFADIAHALANTIRFGGHGERGATVAQHSVHVSQICPPHLARWALLHDAAEAYLGDMASNLKHVVPYFRDLEHRWEWTISQALCVPIVDVKYWDTISLLTERRDNGPWGIDDQELLGSAPGTLDARFLTLNPGPYWIWTASQAEEAFYSRAMQLGII